MGTLLNSAGQITLINHVLQSITTSQLPSLDPPVAVVKAIERLFANFFGGQVAGKHKAHSVSWEKCSCPTFEGGIGVRSLANIIQAYSINLWWKFRTQTNLWSHFMKAKYCHSSHPTQSQSAGSHIWRRMLAVRPIAEKDIHWHIGRALCSIWYDAWLTDISLSKPSDSSLHQVRELFNASSNLSPGAKAVLRVQAAQAVCNQNLFLSDSADLPCWTVNSNGLFSLSSAWNLIREPRPLMLSAKHIWQKLLPKQISLFLWKLFLLRLPIDEGLWSKGIHLASKCSCCLSGPINIKPFS